MKELISCIIPTYNRATVLKKAIESVLSQTYHNWELIIIDDQSTDNTWDIIQEYQKKVNQVRCFQNPDKGANYARNLGIARARGNYIAFLDDDDISQPHRFESQIKTMLKSNTRFIVSWFDVRDRATGKIKRIDKTVLKGAGAGFPSRWMIEKSLLDEVGGFNPRMIAMQDCELSYRLATKYTFAHHDDVVTTMYNTPDSTSSTGERAVKGKIQLLDEVEDLMHPNEAAWWHFSIAMDFYTMGDFNKSQKHFKLSAEFYPGSSNTVAYYYFLCWKWCNSSIIKKGNRKILYNFINYRFPELVRHPVISKADF